MTTRGGLHPEQYERFPEIKPKCPRCGSRPSIFDCGHQFHQLFPMKHEENTMKIYEVAYCENGDCRTITYLAVTDSNDVETDKNCTGCGQFGRLMNPSPPIEMKQDHGTEVVDLQ